MNRRGMDNGLGPSLATCVVALAALVLFILVGCERKDGSAGKAAPATQPATAPVAKVQPATRPSGPLARGSSCVTAECHATYAEAKFVHGPVSERACNACHDDDIGGHRYPLLRNRTSTCTFCHTVSGTTVVQHKALEQGCESCHTPHASDAKFLLKKSTVERTCAACHETPVNRFAHDPFAKGDCTVCHQPHQSETKGLLRTEAGNKHCYSCHPDAKVKMAAARVVHKPADQDCKTCHNPHTTANEHQLVKPAEALCFTCHEPIKKKVETANVKHAAVFTEKRCGNCHDAHAGSYNLLPGRTDQTCLTCHTKEVKAADGRTIMAMGETLGKKVLHGPNRAGNCSACHDPHGAAQVDLLDREFPKGFYTAFDVKKYALCFNCHAQELVLSEKTTHLTEFRDGDVNLHYLHVNRDPKGRSCKTCHDIHASDQPKHMASKVAFEGSKWAMPLAYTASGDGGTCSPGCHKPRTYSRSSPSTRPAGEAVTRNGGQS